MRTEIRITSLFALVGLAACGSMDPVQPIPLCNAQTGYTNPTFTVTRWQFDWRGRSAPGDTFSVEGHRIANPRDPEVRMLEANGVDLRHGRFVAAYGMDRLVQYKCTITNPRQDTTYPPTSYNLSPDLPGQKMAQTAATKPSGSGS